MPKTILEVKDLRKNYGDNIAVAGISFSVKQGEVFGILGPNGAGKTTTLESIETLIPIDGGSIKLDGLDVSSQAQEIKYLIGVQPQNSAFMDKVNLSEQLEQIASTYGEKVDPTELLEKVGLLDRANSYVETLSGGQRQRFSVIASLVHKPKVFFMDEPTTGLDPQARRNLWDLITDIKKSGVTIILTTHYMEEAEKLCDRVAIMDNGKIIAMDKPKNLIKQLLARGFKKTQEIEKASLEDVFIDLTGRALRD
jgi:ABC-2 type transport system ATP-binding protein